MKKKKSILGNNEDEKFKNNYSVRFFKILYLYAYISHIMFKKIYRHFVALKVRLAKLAVGRHLFFFTTCLRFTFCTGSL